MTLNGNDGAYKYPRILNYDNTSEGVFSIRLSQCYLNLQS